MVDPLFMAASSGRTTDPRVRRTRQLLHDALEQLLETKDFEAISIQDLTDAATLNRATFYDHYPDKATLLGCHVALRFRALLDARDVRFDGSCGGALTAIALGVCDYLAGLPSRGCERQRSLDPHLEAAVITVVKGLILDGLRRQVLRVEVPLEMAAATLSWAIYGGAKEWLDMPRRPSSEQAATMVASLVKPVLLTLAAGEPEQVAAENTASGVGPRTAR